MVGGFHVFALCSGGRVGGGGDGDGSRCSTDGTDPVAGSRTGRLATAWTAGLSAASLIVWLAPSEPVIAVAFGFVAGEAIALTVVGIMAVSRSTLQTSG